MLKILQYSGKHLGIIFLLYKLDRSPRGTPASTLRLVIQAFQFSYSTSLGTFVHFISSAWPKIRNANIYKRPPYLIPSHPTSLLPFFDDKIAYALTNHALFKALNHTLQLKHASLCIQPPLRTAGIPHPQRLFTPSNRSCSPNNRSRRGKFDRCVMFSPLPAFFSLLGLGADFTCRAGSTIGLFW